MSRRDQIRMTDDEVSTFLQERHTMNLASHHHDGSIHLVAMWYGFTTDGLIGFETFARSQKVQNLRRDPRLTGLVEDGSTYDQLRGVEIVGTAEISDDPDQLMDIAMSVLDRYHSEVADKDRRAVAEMVIKKRVSVVLRPERTVSWDHRKLAGGY